MANKKRRNPNSTNPPGTTPSRPAQKTGQQSTQKSVARRRPQHSRKAGGAMSKNAIVGIVAGVAVLAVVILIVVNSVGGQSAPPTSASVGQGTTLGSADAKVVVEEYSDFQCPYCGQFALNTFPQIDKTYIEAGQVRWVFKNFQRIGEESKQAGQAGECAAQQGQFWAYHDKLFFNQKGENQGTFNNARLKSFATDLGLDRSAFDSCLDSGRMSNTISQEYNEGVRKGVQATPTFFINGNKLEGARPYAEFQRAIDAALKAEK